MHKARVKQTKKNYFKKKKNCSEDSLKRIIKNSVHYMDIIHDQPPTMYLCSNHSLYIEHYETIIEYTGKRVKLQLSDMQLVLEGENICLEYFSKADLKIRGIIEKILFVPREKGAGGL